MSEIRRNDLRITLGPRFPPRVLSYELVWAVYQRQEQPALSSSMTRSSVPGTTLLRVRQTTREADATITITPVRLRLAVRWGLLPGLW